MSWYSNTFTGTNSCPPGTAIPSLGQTAAPEITGSSNHRTENVFMGKPVTRCLQPQQASICGHNQGYKVIPTSVASTVLYRHTKPDGNQSLQQCFTGTQNQMGTNHFNSALPAHKTRWEPITSTVLYRYTKPDRQNPFFVNHM